MAMWIQLNGNGGRQDDRLMHGTSMGHFQQPFFQFRRDAMGNPDGELDLADSVRPLGHGPLGLDLESVARDIVPRAEFADEVTHAARDGADE